MNRINIYNTIMVASALLAAACLSAIVITAAENQRNLEQLLIDIEEMESRSIRMDEATNELLKELEEIHPPAQEPDVLMTPAPQWPSRWN